MQKSKRYSLNFYRLNNANFVNANLIRVLFTLITLVLHLGICLIKFSIIFYIFVRRNTYFKDIGNSIFKCIFQEKIFSEHLEKEDMVLGAVDAVSDFIDSVIEEIKHCSEVIKNIFTENL